MQLDAVPVMLLLFAHPDGLAGDLLVQLFPEKALFLSLSSALEQPLILRLLLEFALKEEATRMLMPRSLARLVAINYEFAALTDFEDLVHRLSVPVRFLGLHLIEACLLVFQFVATLSNLDLVVVLGSLCLDKLALLLSVYVGCSSLFSDELMCLVEIAAVSLNCSALLCLGFVTCFGELGN